MLEVTTNERGISKNLKKDTIKVLLFLQLLTYIVFEYGNQTYVALIRNICELFLRFLYSFFVVNCIDFIWGMVDCSDMPH
jgi:hypothetical protein